MGAIADSPASAKNIAGELITVPGLAAVLPGDGKYLMQRISGDQTFFTPFNVVLKGIDESPIRGVPVSGNITSSEHWRLLFLEASKLINEPLLVGAVSFARIKAFRGSYLAQSPCPENNPGKDLGIRHPDVAKDWFKVNPDGGYSGLWALLVGVGFHPGSSHISEIEGRDRRIFYRHPDAPADEKQVLIHEHALIFDKVPVPVESMEAGEQARKWLESRQPVDIKHVLDDSLFDVIYSGLMVYSDISIDDVS